jgi:hypothetical protein
MNREIKKKDELAIQFARDIVTTAIEAERARLREEVMRRKLVALAHPMITDSSNMDNYNAGVDKTYDDILALLTPTNLSDK